MAGGAVCARRTLRICPLCFAAVFGVVVLLPAVPGGSLPHVLPLGRPWP
jgi:peptidoglycan/LPS O-acetylase OafA/YrhL